MNLIRTIVTVATLFAVMDLGQAAWAVDCPAGDAGADYVAIENPLGLARVIRENQCAEYIVATVTFPHTVNPIILADVDAVISGGWDLDTLNDARPTQTTRKTVLDGFSSRVMTITANVGGPRRTVVLDNLEFKDSGRSTDPGGAVYVEGPVDVYVRNVTMSNNFASQGGAIYLADGAVLRTYDDDEPPAFALETTTFNAAADMAVAGESAFTDNNAEHGGAIYCDSGASVLFDSPVTISGNVAERSGGGVFADNCGQFTARELRLLGNDALGFSGGGIFMRATSADIDARVAGNVAERDGGGLFMSRSLVKFRGAILNNAARTESGGGVHCVQSSGVSGRLVLGETTIANNRAAFAGGGLFADSCEVKHDDAGNAYSVAVLNNAVNEDFSDARFGVRGRTGLHAGGGIFVRDGSVVLGDTDRAIAVRINDNRVSQQRNADGEYQDIVRTLDPGTDSTMLSTGGGIEVERSSVSLENFQLDGNRSSLGAAANLSLDAELALREGRILENEATGRNSFETGRAVCVNGSGAIAATHEKFFSAQTRDHEVRLHGVRMERNKAHVCNSDDVFRHASALVLRSANAVVDNSVIYDDFGDNSKFSINLNQGASLTLRHSTLATHPSSIGSGNGLIGYDELAGSVTLQNSVFFNRFRPLLAESSPLNDGQPFSSLSVDCIAFSSSLEDSGVLDAALDRSIQDYMETDPLDPDLVNPSAGDLRLRDDSQLIDRCALSSDLRLEFFADVDGNPRPMDDPTVGLVGEPFDPGAFENQNGTAILSNVSVRQRLPAPTELAIGGTEVALVVRNEGANNTVTGLLLDGRNTSTQIEFLGVADGTSPRWSCSGPSSLELDCDLAELLRPGIDHELLFRATPAPGATTAIIEAQIIVDRVDIDTTDNVLQVEYGVVGDTTPPPDAAIFANGFE